MSYEIKEISTRRDLKTFIFLPERIHQGHVNWVPPLYGDEWKYFDREKNKAFAYSDTIMLLAWKDGRPVGRIMGIINHKFNEARNEKTARFGFLETEEDREIVLALLSRVEEWARSMGMTKVIGPYGFSDQDPEGLLVQGFEHRATIVTYHNYEWMPGFIEAGGYSKDMDWVVYKIDVPKEMPEFYKRIFQRSLDRGGFELLEFKRKKDFKPWIHPILSLMNECYLAGNIYGYAPLNEKEMDDLAARYLPILDPRFVKAVTKGGEIAGFVIAMPDLTEGIQKARGRLFPFGFIKILRAAKRTKQLDLLLGAVKDAYRGQGVDVLMGLRMLQSAREAGFDFLDTHHEMETNLKVRGEMEHMGGKIYKVFRAYQKPLV